MSWSIRPSPWNVDVEVTDCRGNRIRALIYSSNFAVYDRNPNHGRPGADAELGTLEVATRTALHDRVPPVKHPAPDDAAMTDGPMLMRRSLREALTWDGRI